MSSWIITVFSIYVNMLKYIQYINFLVLFIILALSYIQKIRQEIFYISCIKAKVGITPFENGCLVHRNFEVPTIEMVPPPIPTLVPTPKLWLTQPQHFFCCSHSQVN